MSQSISQIAGMLAIGAVVAGGTIAYHQENAQANQQATFSATGQPWKPGQQYGTSIGKGSSSGPQTGSSTGTGSSHGSTPVFSENTNPPVVYNCGVPTNSSSVPAVGQGASSSGTGAGGSLQYKPGNDPALHLIGNFSGGPGPAYSGPTGVSIGHGSSSNSCPASPSPAPTPVVTPSPVPTPVITPRPIPTATPRLTPPPCHCQPNYAPPVTSSNAEMSM